MRHPSAKSTINAFSFFKNWKSYQAKPVCLFFTYVSHDVSVRHHFRNHRELLGTWFDFDSNKFQDIRVRYVHPEYGFLAEGLDPMSY